MSDNRPIPPTAAKRPQEFVNHGDRRVDDYYWLRDKSDPEVIHYLEAENEHTQAVMAHTVDLQKELYKEMRARIKETDLSVPVKLDGYYYYDRTEENQQYAIKCRKFGSMDAPEEVLLDQNLLAEGEEYFRVGIFQVSPDHKLLAYSVDTAGAEVYSLRIKDLETGELLPDEIAETYYSFAWSNDNQTLFYTKLNEAMRPYQLYRHRLGTDSSQDELVFQEDDERFYLRCYKTKSKRYILVVLGSSITSEVWTILADEPDTKPKLIQEREHGVEYLVEHHPGIADATRPGNQVDRFIITTNDDALNSRIMETPVETPSKEHWAELVPHREDVKVNWVESFRTHLVVHQREAGLPTIRIMNLKTGEDQAITFPDPVYDVWSSSNPDFETNMLRFNYTSFTTPRGVYEYNLTTQSQELLKEQEVLGGYNREEYESFRLWAIASDGVQIPMSVVRRKDAPTDQPVPLMLYGYGSYESCIDPSFNSIRLSLLERGMTFVIAHVRGGGEMGRHWYEGGKFLKKKNSFTDFVDCAQYLVDEGYTTPEMMIAEGRSAGGLLMGAITNLRPDLFAGIIAGVPFVDVINTMLDPSIPLTVIEYDEWGNPNDPTYYEYMKSYSPYDNLEAKAYPHILATAGLNDPRVHYWEPAKYVAKLRTLKTDSNRLLLKTNMGAGHGGASGRFDYLEEVAFDYAFILDVLDLTDV
ncbi:MAG: S9 family peptidase [Chloroflexota bacterium]